MARITRKELKTDKFALEVENTVTFFEQHQRELMKYGAIVLAAAVLIVGYTMYSRHQRSVRETALGYAIQVQEAGIGAPQPNVLTFPTQEAKDQEAIKVFTNLKNQYSGSNEAEIASYYLASIAADQGKLTQAERGFQEVAQKGDDRYSSLAKLSLAQIYFSDGRDAEGEKALRDLIAHPTVFVSSDQATITLAKYLSIKKPAEARKLLEPLRTKPGEVGQVALTVYGQLPSQ